MKITVITGSAHKNGTSAALASAFIRGAEEAGHEVFRFDAAFKSVHPCLGCEKCHRTGECAFRDDMASLNPHLLECDAIVFVTPIYYFGMNAQIKSVIDRFYANDSALAGNKKTALLLTMADEIEESALGALSSFTAMAHYLNWKICGTVVGKNCSSLEDLKKTDFENQAYNLGRSIS